jgi:hypothetical protein
VNKSDFIELLENKYYSLSKELSEFTKDIIYTDGSIQLTTNEMSYIKSISIKQNLLYELLAQLKK